MDRDRTGYLGPGLKVRGRLSGVGDVRCDADFEGTAAFEGALVIGGRFRGPVGVSALGVEGIVRGPVEAREVRVLEGGRLIGDVRAISIGIDDGGILEGVVDMEVPLPELEPTEPRDTASGREPAP